MSKSGLIWLIIIVALVAGLGILWLVMPEHQRTFWKTFLRQLPNLPGRYMA